MSLDSGRQHRELGGNCLAASQAFDGLDDRAAPGCLDPDRHVGFFPSGMLVLGFRRLALLVAAGKPNAKQSHDHPPSTGHAFASSLPVLDRKDVDAQCHLITYPTEKEDSMGRQVKFF